MRITGGKYCRRNVACPPGVIRPAMDRMRESLFSILGDLSGLSFLDLFSGSGCVAIEAASRGASPIHLVEMDRGKKETIEKNLSFVSSCCWCIGSRENVCTAVVAQPVDSVAI